MTRGIHHITAIASNAQENFNFYTKILGLRFVKKTVNQDDPQTYHLFFGDRIGHPGMDLTFFIFLPPAQGVRGIGQVTKISLAVPLRALRFWKDRFANLKVKTIEAPDMFGLKRITFFDRDNQQLELVGVVDKELDSGDVWVTEEINKESAIRSFHAATLSVAKLSLIDPILTFVFGYENTSRDGNVYLYILPNSQRASQIEVKEERSSDLGFNAAGTVHHIAFRAKDEKEQQEMRDKVLSLGLHPTEVIDRFYFKSVYFRTPSGILFEIATDGPGFVVDEKEENLGKHLALPPFLEQDRIQIESNLSPINTN